jgi:hypothetical protein
LSPANLVSNPSSVGIGTYFVAYHDLINGCYSPSSAVIVTSNSCPATTVDLSTHQNAGIPPAGTILEWHNALPISTSNLVTNSAAVGNGSYYAVYKDLTVGCYSPASSPVVVTIATCNIVNNNCSTAPILAISTIRNTCPSMTVSLSSIAASNQLAGTSLTWHTATPATLSNKISSVAALGAGTYYAALCDMTALCYGPTTAVTATILLCAPPATMACNNYSGFIDHVSLFTPPAAADGTKYVLTDFAGTIIAFGTAPLFDNMPVGQYAVYSVYYNSSQSIPNLVAGSTITSLSGTGISLSPAAYYQVCDEPARYDVKLAMKTIDCATKKMVLQVLVRAHPGTASFIMGDANYRFDYDTRQLRTPVIVSQEHFSMAPPSSDTAYMGQTLNGSSEGPTIGTVSLNTVNSANGAGRLVDTNWTTVSCLSFNILDTALTACYTLTWHNDTAFPRTGMTGILPLQPAGNYDEYDVAAAGVFENLNFCYQNVCSCIALDLKVMLEGPFNSSTGLMNTILNQRGLLPGQTPIGGYAVTTPAGQPFTGQPWNYAGTEGIGTAPNILYDATVVDWVLVSLRTDSTTNTTPFARKAGLLHNDGTISFIDPCWNINSTQRYFAVVEHRNHIGVMSANGLPVQSQRLSFDFTANNGYILTNPPSTGQKFKSGKWMLLAGDGKKESSLNNYDINFSDSQLWKNQSGSFDIYKYGDFNLDADTNFMDNVLWKKNNGQYSGVPH